MSLKELILGRTIRIGVTVPSPAQATNLGTGIGVWKDKIADLLRFRSIKAGDGVSVEIDGDDVVIATDFLGVAAGDGLTISTVAGIATVTNVGPAEPGPYGDGVDGDHTVADNETLTLARNAWYDTLTVEEGGTVDLAGYELNCATALVVDGLVHRDGAVGAPGGGVSNQTGGAGGAALTAANFAGSGAGGTGGGGSDAATAPSALDRLGGKGGAGGTGGTGSAGVGSAGPSADVGTLHYVRRALDFLGLGTTLQVGGNGGSGGGKGGGGDNPYQAVHVAAGGAGAGGGVVRIRAKVLTVSATGIVRAAGGAGGDGLTIPQSFAGFTDAQLDSLGAGAGGGGGGGGAVLVLADSISNLGSIAAPGGVGGAGGLGRTTPGSRDATDGADGDDGFVLLADRLAGTVTIS